MTNNDVLESDDITHLISFTLILLKKNKNCNRKYFDTVEYIVENAETNELEIGFFVCIKQLNDILWRKDKLCHLQDTDYLDQEATKLRFILGTNVTQGSCEDATPTCDLFDICQQNVEKAKELCRKYCNLCDVIDGSWSVWGSWGRCDVTCGNGTKSRVRSCNNPAPAHGGDDCQGAKEQTSTCVLVGTLGRVGLHVALRVEQVCREGSSAFTATGYAPYGYDSIRFPSVILNEGNDYNSATGVFTCRVPGLYIVTATIGNFFGWNVDYVACYIQLNGSNKLRLYHDPQGDDLDGYTSSSTGTFRLQVNDRISVGSCSSREFIYNSTMTSFSAVLIRPDQI
ncbi:ECT-like protein [Mya arenaria]|uniref:ECT-like protein n=1 Tax=Mya arenaria TaxID=6604 RepID=A0ABY7ELY9_MYAAR|nr:ECT-like protein [Mya arenaria]